MCSIKIGETRQILLTLLSSFSRPTISTERDSKKQSFLYISWTWKTSHHTPFICQKKTAPCCPFLYKWYWANLGGWSGFAWFTIPGERLEGRRRHTDRPTSCRGSPGARLTRLNLQSNTRADKSCSQHFRRLFSLQRHFQWYRLVICFDFYQIDTLQL